MKKITLKYDIIVEDEADFFEILDAMEDNVHDTRALGGAYLDLEMEKIIKSVEDYNEDEE